MTRCYLALGSNLNTPVRQLRRAVAALNQQKGLVLVKISRLYRSLPLGIKAQPPYVNLVLSLNTSLSPQRLLEICQNIEKRHQRVTKIHWGPRTLDIDILLYGQRNIKTRALTLPHPQMLYRDFVLIPLLEIDPEVCLPDGVKVNKHLPRCAQFIIKARTKSQP